MTMTLRSMATRLWSDEARQRRALMGLAAAMAVVHVVGILWTSGPRGPFVQGDARAYFAYLPSLVMDRDIDLRNEFAVIQIEAATEFPFGAGFHGRARNPFPVAPALLWLPGYSLGLGIDAATRKALPSAQPLGYGAGAALGTAVWSILLVGVGAEFTRRLVRQGVGIREAFPATIMAWLGTPALYYTVITPLYSHAPAWVAVSVMLWCAWRAAEDPHRLGVWIWSGLAAGWVVAVRLQDAPLLVVPATCLAMTLPSLHSSRRASGAVIVWICSVMAGYLAQGLTWYWLHGEVIPFGGTAAMATPTLSNLRGILFSLGYRGWISWTPLVLPGLIGLGLLTSRRERAVTRGFALSAIAGLVGMVLIDLTHPFGAGAAFGGRRYVSATPLIALGLAALLAPSMESRARRAAWLLLPALTVWNLCLLVSYELLVIRHGVYPTLREAVRHVVGLEAP